MHVRVQSLPVATALTCAGCTGTGMDSQTYFKMNFKSIVTHKQLTEYTILDVELLGPRQGKVCELSPQCALSS